MRKQLVKVPCELCNGRKTEEVEEYQTGKTRRIKCRACYGRGYYRYPAA